MLSTKPEIHNVSQATPKNNEKHSYRRDRAAPSEGWRGRSDIVDWRCLGCFLGFI